MVQLQSPLLTVVLSLSSGRPESWLYSLLALNSSCQRQLISQSPFYIPSIKPSVLPARWHNFLEEVCTVYGNLSDNFSVLTRLWQFLVLFIFVSLKISMDTPCWLSKKWIVPLILSGDSRKLLRGQGICDVPWMISRSFLGREERWEGPSRQRLLWGKWHGCLGHGK